MIRQLTIAATAGLALAAASAQAQTGSPADNYRTYWEAVVAWNHCNDLAKDQDLDLTQYETIDDAIMERIGGNLGAGDKLRIIEDAKAFINQNWATKGCSEYTDPRFGVVRERFELFAAELAPALGITAEVATTP